MTEQFRIIYIIDRLGMGGAERLMVPILKHLDKKHFLPRVCFLQNQSDSSIAEKIRELGISVDFIPVRRLRNPSNIPRLIKYLRQYHADLVHTQLEFSDILGNIASKILRLPSVCTVHTLPPHEKRIRAKLRQRLFWLSHRIFCNRVIAVSEGARKYYLNISKNQPGKVKTIYNGIDPDRFITIEKSKQIKLRRELGIAEDASILITVAVLRPQKGLQYLIDALPAIIKAIPNVYYLVVGSGDYKTALVEMAENAGLKKRIIFSGMRSDIPELLSIADVFVLPTLTEALPTVLMEAMAARKPIIASDVGGVPEIISDKENGFLLPPKDPAKLAEACIELVTAPDLRKKMGDAGWKTVNKIFNIRRQVKQLEILYDELLALNGKKNEIGGC